MLRSVSGMRGFTIHATDGDMGSVDDFLFDDQQWTIRYLVANTGSWLSSRLVLVSPIAFRSADVARETFDVALTRQQVENSPSIATDQPVSRQLEGEYSRYYGYPCYWAGQGLWGAGMYPRMEDMAAVSSTYQEMETGRQPEGDPYLRSAREVTGYAIQARDGDLGHVEDFIVDDESWGLRYLVVDTRNWWPGKHVLVSPRWIDSVSWTESSVMVDLLRETIKEGPEYDPSMLLDRAYESRLLRRHPRRRQSARHGRRRAWRFACDLARGAPGRPRPRRPAAERLDAVRGAPPVLRRPPRRPASRVCRVPTPRIRRPGGRVPCAPCGHTRAGRLAAARAFSAPGRHSLRNASRRDRGAGNPSQRCGNFRRSRPPNAGAWASWTAGGLSAAMTTEGTRVATSVCAGPSAALFWEVP